MSDYEEVIEEVEVDEDGNPIEYIIEEIEVDEDGNEIVDMEEYEEYEEDGEEEDEDEFFSGGDSSFFQAAQKPETKKEDFKVMSAEELINKQHNEVVHAHEVLNIPVSVAGALLRHFGWDKERLYQAFFEDPDRVCKQAGISLEGSTVRRGDPQEEYMCPICYDDYNGNEMIALSCGHFFCRHCWGDYINAMIRDGPGCIGMTCPYTAGKGKGCYQVVDESVVSELASKPLFKKYAKYLSRSFVDDNPHIKWCPAPDCGKAVFCDDSVKSVVKCACGMKFCFKCNVEAHAPCTCGQLKEWLRKERDESETTNWLAVNTKDCPKCHTSIEKNGGCNHMTCFKCKYEFCWVCMGPWAQHGSDTGGYYQCNKYHPGDKKDTSNKEAARLALEKYHHYYTRYANHDRSKRFESQLRKKSEEKMKDLQRINKYSSWVDVEYIQKAVDQLIESRNILKYTYVFAYFLDEGKEKNLFEWLQEDLEKITEKLSEILEAPTDKFNRDEIIRTTRSCETRLNNLLEGVEGGLTNS